MCLTLIPLSFFFTWSLQSLNLDMSKWAFQSKIKNRMASSVDLDETARYEPSHLDLQYLHKYTLWPAKQRCFRRKDTLPSEKTITKTCLYNIDPLKPHFYIVKLGFTGVYFIFLISAQRHRLWYSLKPPRRGGSNEYPQSMF